MKKIKYLLTIMLATFMSISFVNADGNVYDSNSTLNYYTTLESAYAKAYEIIKDNPYQYYTIYSDLNYYVTVSLFDSVSYSTFFGNDEIYIKHYRAYEYTIRPDGTVSFLDFSDMSSNLAKIDIFRNDGYTLYDTNFNYVSTVSFELSGIFNDNILISSGQKYPTLKQLLQYNSWNDYYNNEIFKEVNLDNYEYVILSLKDYSKTDAFNVNLQVKGMIGITPIYEFGTIEKEVITDRCNISYSEYTDYRFSILKNDLINNAVYYVKGCQDESSFKFDSSIFNITYVTADNVDDPVITVGGTEYHTIPFSKLSNSANQNESNNFIPGESTDGSINTVINSITDYISNFWNGLVTFMGLVTKFFNTLPIEIRAISITAFSTALTLGIIKFIKS